MIRSPFHCHCHRAAFTLPEVLAALVLIGLVLPASMKGVTVAMQAASRARHHGEAVELARHKLTELSLATDVNSYAAQGDFGDEWPEYWYESRFFPGTYGTYEVTVEVFFKSRGQDESITLTTWAFPGAFVLGTAAAGSEAGTGPAAAGGSPP